MAKDIGVGILFEPIHEYENISKDVWDKFGIKDTRKYKEAVGKIIEMKRQGKPVLNSYTLADERSRVVLELWEALMMTWLNSGVLGRIKPRSWLNGVKAAFFLIMWK